MISNPRVTSKLWTKRPKTGVELPLEVQYSTSPLGVNYVAWNSGSTLKLRFDLNDKSDAAISIVDFNLARLAGIGTDRTFAPVWVDFDADRLQALGSGVGMVQGRGVSPAGAYTRLVDAVSGAAGLGVRIGYKVSHDVAARELGLGTRGLVDRVVVFGNARLGSGIIQTKFTAGIDLPVKIGVWGKRKGKRFSVGFVRPEWVGKRHGVEVDARLSAAVERFVGVAAKGV